MTRRHRHRLGRHAGHLLPHQPAPLRRGPHQPLLRGRARDPVPVAGRADALSRATSASTTPRSAPSSTGLRRRRRSQPDDIDTGVVILTGEALRRENARGDRRTAGRAARRFRLRHRRPPHGSRCWRPTAPARRSVSHEDGKRILNVDIGGGTTKLGIVEKRQCGRDRRGAYRRPLAGGRRHRPHRRGSIRPAATTRARPASTGIAATCCRRRSSTRSPRRWPMRWSRRSASVRCRLRWRSSISPIRSRELGRIDGVMFSGGVGEYVYGREDRDFGDMGRRLGRAVRRGWTTGALPWPLLPAGECIRATALGASEYSVQLSGNTSYISKPGELLPRRNLQVLQPPFACAEVDRCRRRSRRRSATISPPSIWSRAKARWRSRCAGSAPPSYERIAAFAEGIRRGLATTIERRKPLYVMLDGDIAQTLGAILREELAGESEILAIDGVRAAGFRLHRSRPRPHAVIYRAGDDQVAGVQRGPAPRTPAAAHPSPRASTTASRIDHDHAHHARASPSPRSRTSSATMRIYAYHDLRLARTDVIGAVHGQGRRGFRRAGEEIRHREGRHALPALGPQPKGSTSSARHYVAQSAHRASSSPGRAAAAAASTSITTPRAPRTIAMSAKSRPARSSRRSASCSRR